MHNNAKTGFTTKVAGGINSELTETKSGVPGLREKIKLEFDYRSYIR